MGCYGLERRYLNDADIGFLVRLVGRDPRNAFDPVLDRARNMRHDLVGVLVGHTPSH